MEEGMEKGDRIGMPSFDRLAKIFGWLLPPACREHVLGDLQERAKSRWQFAKEVTLVLAPVIVSRIRRVTDPQVLLMQALALYASFVAAAWYSGESSFLYQGEGLLRLAIPTAVSIAVLLLCMAHANPEQQSLWQPVLHATTSISLGLLGQAFLFDTCPSLAVPLPVLLEGGCIGVVLVSTLQVLFPLLGHHAKFFTRKTLPQSPRAELLPAKIFLQRSRVTLRGAELPAWKTWATIAALVFVALFAFRLWLG
jgi:hypothetical protein